MFGIIAFAGAGLAGMWGIRTAAALLLGGEVIKKQMLKREVNRAFKLDLNPGHGADQSFGVVELTQDDLPPEMHEFVGKYIVSKTEATVFLAALQDRMSGSGELADGYDFAWMQKVQENRRADGQFSPLLQ